MPSSMHDASHEQGAADDSAPTREAFGGVGAPGLTLVATPIGNLGDITQRALSCLRAADLVACEDTRVTRRLLSHFGIKANLIAYHDHNAARVLPGLIEKMAAGQRVCLVSDAGTPLISDPGLRLVQACHSNGISVTAAPGPSAAMTALSLAGLPTDRALFAGFLPVKAGPRQRELAALMAIPATLVLYEAPNRLAATLAACAALDAARPAAICRELTKRFEEIRRDNLDRLAAHYSEAGAPKGEIVLVIGPPERDATLTDPAAVDAALRRALERHGVKQAASVVATETGLPKRELYQRALALRDQPGSDDDA